MTNRVSTLVTRVVWMTKRNEWFAALADVFDLRFDASAPGALDHLWNQTLAGHRAWEAAGRQQP
jgi:N-hydroxyarylamine O-acetyltransferase